MARYIKANPKVTQFLRLENDRNQVKDGNYLLWQNDMLAFGKLINLPQILAQIGAIALASYEAREEQDGTVTRELPVATDPRFIVEVETDDETAEDPQEETPAEGTEVTEETDAEAGDEAAEDPTDVVEDPEAEAEATDETEGTETETETTNETEI